MGTRSILQVDPGRCQGCYIPAFQAERRRARRATRRRCKPYHFLPWGLAQFVPVHIDWLDDLKFENLELFFGHVFPLMQRHYYELCPKCQALMLPAAMGIKGSSKFQVSSFKSTAKERQFQDLPARLKVGFKVSKAARGGFPCSSGVH